MGVQKNNWNKKNWNTRQLFVHLKGRFTIKYESVNIIIHAISLHQIRQFPYFLMKNLLS